MKEKIEYEKIRELLQNWYEGFSSPEEETDLIRMLAALNPVPEEFAADKALFDQLFAEEGNPGLDKEFSMPQKYDEKILSALEREMAAERIAVSRKHTPFFRRYSWLAAAVVGLILLGGGLTMMRVAKTTHVDVPSLAVRQISDSSSNMIKDTVVRQQPLLAYAPLSVSSFDSSEEKSSKAGNGRNLRSSHNNQEEGIYLKNESVSGEEKFSTVSVENSSNSYYDYSEEERVMLNSKYRVVRDEKEADALLDNIFSRLETAIDNESFKISKVAIEYDSKMLRLNEDEYLTPYNEKYHEYTPI